MKSVGKGTSIKGTMQRLGWGALIVLMATGCGASSDDDNNGRASGSTGSTGTTSSTGTSSSGGGMCTNPNSWHSIDPDVHKVYDDFNAIDFVDANHGWVVGDQGTILRTKDGGATWEKLGGGELGKHFGAVDFIDQNVGWIAADEKTILSTTDGGDTWTSIALPAKILNRETETMIDLEIGDAIDIKVFDANTLWLALINNTTYMYFTNDGGKTWEATSNFAGSMHVINEDTFLFTRRTLSGFGKTTDGGKTFTYMQQLPGGFQGGHFFDENNGWMVRANGVPQIFRVEPGEKFSEQSITNVTDNGGLYDAYFISETTGWAVGDDKNLPYVVHTTDGGATWAAQTIEEPSHNSNIYRLTAVTAVDKDNVWAVGGSATLLRYGCP